MDTVIQPPSSNYPKFWLKTREKWISAGDAEVAVAAPQPVL